MKRLKSLHEKMDTGDIPNFIDPGKRRRIETGKHPYGKNPAFPGEPGEEDRGPNLSYAEHISADQYTKLAKALERYTGKKFSQQTVMASMQSMMGTVGKIMSFEKGHETVLEQLAIDAVLDCPEFKLAKSAYLDGQLEIVAKLNPPKIKTPLKQKELSQDMPKEVKKELDEERSKRLFINVLTQGAAINKNYLFHMVEDRLNDINPGLVKGYGTLMATADLAYWLLPEEMQQAMMGSGEGAAGKARLSFEGGKVTVHAEAMVFPVLVQEICKGLMEFIAYDEDEDPETRREVQGAEALENDPWEVKFGPAIYRHFMRALGDRQDMMPYVYQHLTKLSPGEFSRVAKNILQGTADGKKYVRDIIGEVENNLGESTMTNAKQMINSVFEGDRLEYLKKTYLAKVTEKAKTSRERGVAEDPEGAFMRLVMADPSSKENYAGSYAEWIIRNYLKGDSQTYFEDLVKIKENLDLFTRFKSQLPADKRDLNKLTPADLYKLLKPIRAKNVAARQKARTEEEVDAERKVLYKDEAVIVIQPLTFKAARKYGGDTHWCTSASGGEGNFKYYTQGNKYLVIFRFKDGFKAQLEGDPSSARLTQLKDVDDVETPMGNLLSHYTASGGEDMEAYVEWLSTLVNIRGHAAAQRFKGSEGNTAMLSKLTRIENDEPLPNLVNLAKAKDLSREELAKLKKIDNPRVQRLTNAFQELDEEDFMKGLQHEKPVNRLLTAKNPRLPEKLMQWIVDHGDKSTHFGLEHNEAYKKLPKDHPIRKKLEPIRAKERAEDSAANS